MTDRNFYRQMDHRQFTAALDEIGLSPAAFAYLTGSDHRRVRRWLSGEESSIPHWVTLVCTLFVNPVALPLAFALARAMVYEPEEESR